MKNIIPFVLVFGACASFLNLANAQTQPSVPIVAPDRTRNLLNKPFGGWIVPGKYWTNTPVPIWLGGLQGQVTVVEFFRINCPHCQDAAPSRRALYKKYNAAGLKMVGFHSPGIIADSENEENNWAQVKKQVKNWGLTYPVAFDKDRAFFDKNELRFYPTVLVLDGQGIVRFQQTGYSPAKAAELDAFVGQMLKAD